MRVLNPKARIQRTDYCNVRPRKGGTRHLLRAPFTLARHQISTKVRHSRLHARSAPRVQVCPTDILCTGRFDYDEAEQVGLGHIVALQHHSLTLYQI